MLGQQTNLVHFDGWRAEILFFAASQVELEPSEREYMIPLTSYHASHRYKSHDRHRAQCQLLLGFAAIAYGLDTRHAHSH